MDCVHFFYQCIDIPSLYWNTKLTVSSSSAQRDGQAELYQCTPVTPHGDSTLL